MNAVSLVVRVLVWWWWPAGDEFVTLRAALVFSAPAPSTYAKEHTHLEELTLCPSEAVTGCTSNLEGTPKMAAPRLGHRGIVQTASGLKAEGHAIFHPRHTLPAVLVPSHLGRETEGNPNHLLTSKQTRIPIRE